MQNTTRPARIQASPMRIAATNLILDVALLLVFLLLFEERATGTAIHEWVGLAMGAGVVLHLLWHWTWVVTATRRFFQRMKGKVRLSYLLNAALFVAFTMIMVSGIMISHVVLPLFGLEASRVPFWSWLHHTASDVTLLLVAAHIGLHWSWLLNVVKRMVSSVSPARTRQPDATPVARTE